MWSVKISSILTLSDIISLLSSRPVMIKQLIILAVILSVVWASELKEQADNWKCRGHDIDLDDEEMATVLECAMENHVSSKADLTPEKKACMAKCIVVKKGYTDADGKAHKEKIMEKIGSKVPDSLKDQVKMHLSKCLDENGSKIKADDATCQTFQPLTDCIHAAYLQICKSR